MSPRERGTGRVWVLVSEIPMWTIAYQDSDLGQVLNVGMPIFQVETK